MFMPRYFFDLHNDVDARDDEGHELPNLKAAKLQALKEARGMIGATLLETGEVDLSHSIRLRDEGGTVIGLIAFDDAVTILRGGEPV